MRSWLLRGLVEGVVFATIVGAATAAVGPYLGERVLDATRAPTCSDTRDLVRIVPTSAKASSTLPDQGDLDYGASKAYDGDSSTAWVEGRPGLGFGQYIEFSFARPAKLELLCIVDGYASSWTLYQRNPRIRGLDVVTDDTTFSTTLEDAGSPDHPAIFQPVSLSSSTRRIRLTITSVYAGLDANRYTDTSLSEVEFWGSGKKSLR